MRIPVGDMENLAGVEKDEVPGNPYRVPEVVEVENIALDDAVEADVIVTSEYEVVTETANKLVPEKVMLSCLIRRWMS